MESDNFAIQSSEDGTGRFLPSVFGRFSRDSLSKMIVAFLVVLVLLLVLFWKTHKKSHKVSQNRKLTRRERRELDALEAILNNNADDLGSDSAGSDDDTQNNGREGNSIMLT